MSAILDHIFICTAIGAPAAEKLRQFGLTEGLPNHHPGQGTACRRFFSHNATLELLWVENETEARSEQTRATRLWERWSTPAPEASPFGIILRPGPCPFPSWDYRPKTMPDLALRIAKDTGLDEPMWCYMEDSRTPANADRRITRVRIHCPPLKENSVTKAMARNHLITLETSTEHLLVLLR